MKNILILERHKYFIKYLKVIDSEMVVPALDNLLKLKLITKIGYKVILKEIQENGKKD